MPKAELDTLSYWESSSSISRYPRLDRDLTVDVAVIGGGITGFTAAYLLKRSGRSVA
jgi:ribulose 1,5-bisphosphate synthetase/thiazole synthase